MLSALIGVNRRLKTVLFTAFYPGGSGQSRDKHRLPSTLQKGAGTSCWSSASFLASLLTAFATGT
jgi:hypothetical protein